MKNWLFRTLPEGVSHSPPSAWAEDLSISPLLLEILWRRGFTQKQAINAFLDARPGSLTPPHKWPQIPDAAQLLAHELLAGKKLVVWGDYDVDGITAATLVLDVLESHGLGACWHIPDRRSEGYGLNVAQVEALAEQGCGILLTVDCGIADTEAVQRARQLGMTVVVSDHHLAQEQLPPAHAICNPRICPADTLPCPHLAGVGVAFYLMGAVNAALAPHTGQRHKMDLCLDLVALGTLADIMPLTGENRILVHAGLAHLAMAARPGIAALKVASGMDAKTRLTSGQVSFQLVPRINAAGRIGSGGLALRLLRQKDFSSALPLAQQLDGLNTERKNAESEIHNEARIQALDMLSREPLASLVLYGQDWHPGIVGIVASRIVEEFYRPTIILCHDQGSLKGSGRSVREFDLHAGLNQTAEALLGFGGHRLAAGVRLLPENLGRFRDAFEAVVAQNLGTSPLSPSLTLECQLDFAQASDQLFLKELEMLQPFGPGNAEPVFASPPLLVKDRSPLGRSGEHVRLRLQDEHSGLILTAKAWRMGQALPPGIAGKRIRVAYTPRLDTYNGITSVDVGIKDWQPA